MNPHYISQQDSPDGKSGHDERNVLYKQSQSKSIKNREPSDRYLNKFISSNDQSLMDLQIEIRMKQCKSKTEHCYEESKYEQCLYCPEYTL